MDVASPKLEAMGITPDDPSFQAMQATEPATKEEEVALGRALESIMDFMYSEEGMASIVQVINADERPLYQSLPEIGKMLITKAQSDLQSQGIDPESSIYFGEGGLLQQIPLMLFDLAEQMGKPGADDEDQLAATVISMYKMAGEHIEQTKDADAQREAVELGQEVALTDDDGSVMDPAQFTKKYAKKGKNVLEESVQKGLLEI